MLGVEHHDGGLGVEQAAVDVIDEICNLVGGQVQLVDEVVAELVLVAAAVEECGGTDAVAAVAGAGGEPIDEGRQDFHRPGLLMW